MRILQVVGGMNRGGVETWLMHVLRNIDRDRFKIDFLVHTTLPCAYDEEIRSFGSRITPCLDPLRPWSYIQNFKRILKEQGPYDVVHSHVYLFSGLILYLASQANIPIRIAHIHPQVDSKAKHFLRKVYQTLMTTLISQNATYILAPSKSSLKAFLSICATSTQTDIVYNGVDLADFSRNIDRINILQKYSLPIKKPIIIYVARFAPHKNHEQVLRVAEQINYKTIQAHFVLVGSHGEILEALKEQICDRGDISIITGVENIIDLLKASDIFFFPSLNEGFGVVAIEAAAAGLPIVATDIPTIREACPPSHHAFMFTPDNDKVACNNILKILKDNRLRDSLSADSKRWASDFSIVRSVNKLTSIYSMEIQYKC